MEIYCERVRDLLNPSSANKVGVMTLMSRPYSFLSKSLPFKLIKILLALK